MSIPALLTKAHGLRASLTDEALPAEPDKTEFLQLIRAFFASGGTSRYGELAQLLNEHQATGHDHLDAWIASKQLLAFEWHLCLWIPMFQFDLNHLSLKPVVHQIRMELDPSLSGWLQARWFAEMNARLHGRRPVDLIDTAPQGVLEAAREDRQRSKELEIGVECPRPPRKARLLSRTLH